MSLKSQIRDIVAFAPYALKEVIMKKHIIKEKMQNAQPAYIANGVVGLRVGQNPLIGQTALLAGFTGAHEKHGVEAFAPVPAPSYDISMDGSHLLKFEEGYKLIQQSYDFSNAEFETEFEFINKKGQSLIGKSLIYASRSCPTLIVQILEFTVNQDCDFVFESLFDPNSMPIITKKTLTPNYNCTGVLLLSSRDNSTDAGLAHCIITEGEDIRKIEENWGYEEDRLYDKYYIEAKKGQTYAFKHLISYVPGVYHSEPHFQAVRMVELATWKGFDRLKNENRKLWANLWESRVELDCDNPLWQDVIDSSFFYLYCSLHSSSPQSVAPFGLSQRDLYKGHVFWDTESFMFNLPLLTQPDIAKAMLDYRFDRIKAAEHNAKINGYLGIQFPWQSGKTGDEVTRVSAGGAGGAGEQHVNMDVAMAFIAYWKCSKDKVYLKEKVWPIVYGVSKWIESRVEKTDRGYEILFVTGIDEGSDNVNNDSFTNIICKLILDETNKIALELGYDKNTLWQDIADKMYLPINKEKNYMMQYENCKEKPSMPPESLMAFFPYFYSHSKEVDENSYRFFIEHDLLHFLSYPMLSGFLGVIPARLGDRKLAREFFEAGNLSFFTPPYMMCIERSFDGEAMEKSPDGGYAIFLTGRGSLLTGLMMGLTNMNIYKDDINEMFEGTITLPEGFNKLTLNKIYIKGRPAKVIAENSKEKAEIIWL